MSALHFFPELLYITIKVVTSDTYSTSEHTEKSGGMERRRKTMEICIICITVNPCFAADPAIPKDYNITTDNSLASYFRKLIDTCLISDFSIPKYI